MVDAIGQRFRSLHEQFEMFRRESVAQLCAGFQVIADHHQPPVAQGGFADLPAGVPLELKGDLGSDRLGQRRIGGDQNGSGQRVVLGLGQQISSHLGRHSALVGDHQHLAGTRQGIDAHLAIDGLLGQGHIQVSGAADHIHFRHAFGAESHGGHGLGASDPHHGADAGEVGCGEHHRVHMTIGSGR